MLYSRERFEARSYIPPAGGIASGRLRADRAAARKDLRPNPLPRTIEEIASFEGSPRFARRLICIGFSGQKRIGDFERRKEKLLITEFIRFEVINSRDADFLFWLDF